MVGARSTMEDSLSRWERVFSVGFEQNPNADRVPKTAARYPLFIACCSLPAVHCLLFLIPAKGWFLTASQAISRNFSSSAVEIFSTFPGRAPGG